MAHQQQRATEFHEQILQQLQRLRIEIVRRLVEHEYVARFREEPRQQQPVPLAARQRLDRGARPRRIEEKIFEVGNHVPRLAVDRHRRITVGHCILHPQRLVELRAQLVEVDHFQPCALLDRAHLRRDLPEHEPQQRRFAGTVGAHDPDLIPALNPHRQIAHDPAPFIRIAKARFFTLDHLKTTAVRLLRGDRRLARAVATCSSLGPHFFERMDAVAGPRPLRLHTPPDPHFFLREFLIELRALHLLGLEDSLFPHEKRVVVARPSDELTAVDLDDARRELPQKRPVVRHEQQRSTPLQQKFFEPLDGFQIEMVRRLIEQQQLRLLHQSARQQHATLLSRRQCRELMIHRQPHALEQPLDAVVALPVIMHFVRATLALDHGAHRALQSRRHFLPKTGENRAGLAENLADIRVQFARDDLHQRGLARTVTADETYAFAAVNLEIDLIEQRRATEAQGDIKKTDNGHVNPTACTTPPPQRKVGVQYSVTSPSPAFSRPSPTGLPRMGTSQVTISRRPSGRVGQGAPRREFSEERPSVPFCQCFARRD